MAYVGRGGGRECVASLARSPGVLTATADGKLLMMTPVDPAFLLVPILQALVTVSVLQEPHFMPYLPEYQPRGELGNFRPMDELFEDAVETFIRSPPAVPNLKDPSSEPSKEDMLYFLSLDCARHAMPRICDSTLR